MICMMRQLTLKEEQVGIFRDSNGGLHLDCKKFAEHIKENMHIICSNSNVFYIFDGGVWKYWEIGELKKYLFEYIDLVNKDIFTLSIQEKYLGLLSVMCYDNTPFNTQKRYINMRNGILDTKEMKLLKHTQKLRSTIQIPIKYDKTAACPTFEKFLDSTFQSDEKLIAVVQEMMGYCLSSSVKAQKFFVLYGTGANGKSVLCNIIKLLVGSGNYSTLSARDLSKGFSRATLKDKILNIATENECQDGKQLDSQYIKAIVGGDEIAAEFKGKDVFSFKPICKLVFAVNSLPKFNDKSYGFLRRVMIIPFNAKFSIEDGTADINLEEKLQKELPGILNFALEGLRRLRANNYCFTLSEKVEQFRKEYEEMIDPYIVFFNEHIIITGNKSDTVPRELIYKTFLRWACENNHTSLAKVSTKKFWLDFNNLVARLGYEELKIKKVRGNRSVVGICLKPVNVQFVIHQGYMINHSIRKEQAEED